jgi:hypothetical protein
MTVKKSFNYTQEIWLCHQTFKKELKGFQKIILRKGEKRTVTFEISIEDLKFYNSDIICS